jgi:hypothetical protein
MIVRKMKRDRGNDRSGGLLDINFVALITDHWLLITRLDGGGALPTLPVFLSFYLLLITDH